jgi:hypothetical protein
VGLVIDLNAERKRREGMAAAMEAMSVTEFRPACWHRPYLQKGGAGLVERRSCLAERRSCLASRE